ncbi:hypothetical protein [Streptomyces tendae]|uniref:Uncharacterized protein n=1 Tax=Streptomyces tendae TaxID=1932 RepID=A0ABW7SF58_STRTE|nr:hypothetical protein [Streptomyces sp. SID5914]MZG14129.1 hypothetical protein [Streptomyces sp. SID5914]
MSELEILQMATPAAQALLSCMVSDAWQATKGKFAKLLGRDIEGEVQIVESDLEESRRGILENSSVSSEVTTEVWKARFRQALIANPEMADDLRALLNELGVNADASNGNVSQTAVARDNSVVFQQASGVQKYYGSTKNNE